MTERLAVDAREFPELRDINDTLAGFALVQKGMRHTHSEGHVALCHSKFPASSNEPRNYAIIILAQLSISTLPRSTGLEFWTSCHTLKCGELLTNPLIRDTLVWSGIQDIDQMEKPKIEFPEVVGKVLAELSIFDDTLYGREVLVRFTDETQLSIVVGVRQSIDARYCSEDAPDQPFFVRND